MSRKELLKSTGLFDRDLEAYVLKHRAELAVAILTAVRAYRVSGERVAISPYGSFEAWSRTVRESLIWLGQADPLATRGTIRRRDPDLDAMHAILTAWHAVHGERPLKIAEAAEDEKVKAAMRDYAWNDKTGKTDLLKVARLLSRYEGRVFGGARIDKAGTNQGITRWVVALTG